MVGIPIVTAGLHGNQEFLKVSRPRVARLMNKMGLRYKTVRKFVVTTHSKHKKSGGKRENGLTGGPFYCCKINHGKAFSFSNKCGGAKRIWDEKN